MIRLPSNIFFILVQSWVFVFWILPEEIQKPFRIILLLMSFFISLHVRVPSMQKIASIMVAMILLLISLMGAFQTSVINILLSTFAILIIEPLYKEFTKKQMAYAKKLLVLCCISMFIQLLFYRDIHDGRPKLSYELNWGAAYLFIFYLYNDLLKNNIGKFFVLFASAVMLSRLLVYALLIYYFFKYFGRLFRWLRVKWIIAYTIISVTYFIFNFWSLTSWEFVGDTASSERMTNFNDGSNRIRFTVNTLVLTDLFLDNNPRFLWGYGQITKDNSSNEYLFHYNNQPHNELIDSICEFGYVATIIFMFFSFYYHSKYFSSRMYGYYIPIIIYTTILWARFLIVPSPEMFFILFLIVAKSKQYEKNDAKLVTHYK